MNEVNVAVIGATGMVGGVLLDLLASREFPVRQLYLLASGKSAGDTVYFKNQACQVQSLDTFDFTQTQLAFFCAGNEISEKYAPLAAAAGNLVIDKSSCFRNDPDVPLVVPEVNAHVLRNIPRNIVASPNCSTIPLAMVLKPLHDLVGVTRLNVATYQSVSGSGRAGVNELTAQSESLLANRPVTPGFYAHQIAFNVLPLIDSVEANGYTREEMKVVHETWRLLEDDSIAINVTAVRVPVFYGHSAAVHLETRKKITAADALGVLQQSPGVRVFADVHKYPSPAQDAAGQNEVFVGRLREDISHPHGLDCWVVADNIRKGAALNALQIAEVVFGFAKLR